MSIAMDMTARASAAGSLALRLAADPRAYRAGALIARGCPSLALWLAGWCATEFGPRAVTGHALSTVRLDRLDRVSSGMASQRANAVLEQALSETFGERDAQVVHPLEFQATRPSLAGFWHATQHRRRYATATTNISYGPHGRDHLLDIWRLPSLPPDRPAPVLLQVPGGAWALSEKRGQAYPLMSRLVALGWICVSINYSRSPGRAFPSHIIDVKRAIAWVRDNIADYGGDPNYIAITGGSAGGHLASLAALTAGDPTLQPGFEHADTSVQAAVPYYGAYDLTNVETMTPLMLPLLEEFVMRARLAQNRELFEAASPTYRVHREAPPFFVLHGANDAVIPRAQARDFVAALRGAGAEVVAHAELPNAHHAFDALATARSQLTADAVAQFLGVAYGRHLLTGVELMRATPAS
ncbi:alpha/beta hydrolase [Mycolicibacterium mengxianglii]|uniref:alpha/beta hydrolase n=1 Tax=Mycolicibacterium mengxianglii TaxID=2736649 RepID=UPI0018EF14ED|nr:alpha/beta hydrolase [Mycolicibacterium mengxianglii]